MNCSILRVSLNCFRFAGTAKASMMGHDGLRHLRTLFLVTEVKYTAQFPVNIATFEAILFNLA